jgi:hypothetical protein
MSSPKIRYESVPAPIDGLNLIDPPSLLKDTEARVLDNYYIFNWGIRQRGLRDGSLHTFGGTPVAFIPIRNDPRNSNADSCLIVAGGHLYYNDTSVFSGPTDLGAVSITTDVNWCIFNKQIYIYCSSSAGTKYDIAAGTNGAMGWTGPTNNLVQGTGYNNRMYAVELNTSKVWYPTGADGVGAITGAMVSLNFDQVFSDNANLLFVTNWTYNQGLSNEDLFVAVSETGEVLVYSGSFPGASDWGLAGRTRIPKPLGRSAWYKLGQELYIKTGRGIIPLSQVFTGTPPTDVEYYSASKNLGSSLGSSSTPIAFNYDDPFLYFVDGTGNNIYVLNYERGAWSRFTFGAPVGILCYVFNQLYYIETTQFKVYRIANNGVQSSPSLNYAMKTKFFDFSSPNMKNIQEVRVIMRSADIGGTYPDTTTLYINGAISPDYSDTNIGAYSSANGDSVPGDPQIHVQKIYPPGIGVRFSLSTLESPATLHYQNEILGFDFIFEEGGLY